MAQPLTRTPDFPDFDTYPGGIPGSAHLLPKLELRTEQGSEGMNQAAEKVGSAVGSAVKAAQRLPQQVNSTLNSTLRSVKKRLVLVKGRTAEQLSTRSSGLKQTASDTARNAQERARWIAREYPLHVIAGVAALAFVAGFGLRIWRGSRG